jgi:hypothetical protein
VVNHLLMKNQVNLRTNRVDIHRIEVIIIQCISNEVVDQLPLIFSEQLAVDSLGEGVAHVGSFELR